mgnify:CR=1 FL=1
MQGWSCLFTSAQSAFGSWIGAPVGRQGRYPLWRRLGSGGDQGGSPLPIALFCGVLSLGQQGDELAALLDRVLEGRAEPADLERLAQLCAMVRDTSLCGLGQAAPSPVLSSLRWFRGEYEAAISPEGSVVLGEEAQP